MRIGLFGGTFNPVHNGHLISAQAIIDKTGLDKIIFIPSKYPVHKTPEGLASAEDRFNMIKMAVNDNPDFEVSRIEIDREDDSYFIITFRQLADEYPEDSLYVILGADAFADVLKWKDHEELLDTASFLLLKRPSSDSENTKLAETKENIKKIIEPDNPLIDISSSQIRKRIRNKKAITGLVPAAVEKYIAEKRLYSV